MAISFTVSYTVMLYSELVQMRLPAAKMTFKFTSRSLDNSDMALANNYFVHVIKANIVLNSLLY